MPNGKLLRARVSDFTEEDCEVGLIARCLSMAGQHPDSDDRLSRYGLPARGAGRFLRF